MKNKIRNFYYLKMITETDLIIIHEAFYQFFGVNQLIPKTLRFKLMNGKYICLWVSNLEPDNSFIERETLEFIMDDADYILLSEEKDLLCSECGKNTDMGFQGNADNIELCEKCYNNHKNVIVRNFNDRYIDEIYYCNNKIIIDYQNGDTEINFCYSVSFIEPLQNIVSHRYIEDNSRYECEYCSCFFSNLLLENNGYFVEHFMCDDCYKAYLLKMTFEYSQILPYFSYILKLYLPYDLCDYMLKNITFSLCLNTCLNKPKKLEQWHF